MRKKTITIELPIIHRGYRIRHSPTNGWWIEKDGYYIASGPGLEYLKSIIERDLT